MASLETTSATTTASMVNQANMISAGGDQILQFATFKLNSELFGINILQVQEIQLPQPVTPVPRGQAHILGLISLRGQIVTLIDLRRRLRMETDEPIGNPYHIVVRTESTIACFEVDEIGDVINVPVEEFRPPPDSVHAVNRVFLEGVFPMERRILAVLRMEEVLDSV